MSNSHIVYIYSFETREMGDRMRKRILKKFQEKKNQKKRKVVKEDYFSQTPEAMYGKIAEYSPSVNEGRITVQPKWFIHQLNSQYRDTVRPVEVHNHWDDNFNFTRTYTDAYWIHQTEIKIRLPFIYDPQTKLDSLEYKMILTDVGARKRNEIFNTPVPPGEIEMEFSNDTNRPIFPMFYVGQYTFIFKYKVKIPNSQQIEANAREEHEAEQEERIEALQQQARIEAEQEGESDPELELDDMEEDFVASDYWERLDVEGLYTDDQIRDMRRRWKEHLIQLAPKACNLLLPSSTTKPGYSTYKLRKDHDYLLTEEFWRSEIQNGNDFWHNFIVQNNKATMLSKKGGWVVNLKAPLKF